jgi:hypothetical protein
MVIYYVVGLACLIVIFHYGTKILDWNSQRNKQKFKDNKSEFTSDLYKLQQKWNNKGEFDYSRALNEVIFFFCVPKEPDAATHYGRELQKKLKELNEKEIDE